MGDSILLPTAPKLCFVMAASGEELLDGDDTDFTAGVGETGGGDILPPGNRSRLNAFDRALVTSENDF